MALDWKLLRDPYLGPLAAEHGETYAFEAGFFRDEDPEPAALDDVDWLCTPLPRRGLEAEKGAAGRRPIVLLSTGAFCPVHDGHVAMMERARVAAEGAGFDVLAGYLSPGHDAYLALKCGLAAIPASERLRRCAAAAARTDWLLVDPWEALHRRVAVNYTDVTARLRAYLRAHVDPRVDVLYVCGGDNARFGLAFVDDGGCIVVGRPGPDAETETTTFRERLEGSERILFCEGDHPAASRAVRPPVWIEERKRRLVVRVEDARAVRTLGVAPARFAAFQEAVVALLAEVTGGGVRTEALQPPAAESDVISLDAMLPAAHNLAMSRLFALGGHQQLDHVARPGARSLEEQVAAIPPGDYVLRDDDRMTGGTLAAAASILPSGVRIVGTRLAVEHAPDEEVADSRDFLLGADDGGLVVALPGGAMGRVPYVLPYVDPAVRCSVPGHASHSFSMAIWALGERVFEESGLCVRDLPLPSRLVFGWALMDRPLSEVCRWHRERLLETSSIRVTGER